MINFEYFCLPALYVKDISSDVIHMDTINMLYLKKKSEADKDIKALMKFLNGR